MKIFDTDSFQEIWATIARNKVRSIATGFGVLWGLFMLIVLLAFGNKFKNVMKANIGDVVVNSVFFQPNRTTEPYQGYRKGRYWDFNNRDLELIRQRARSVDLISPILAVWGSDKNTVRGMKSGSYDGVGVYPAEFRIEAVKLLKGRLLNDVDVTDRRKVCVIGKTVYETLFEPGEDPLGQFIRFNGIYFQVVGVASTGSNAMNIMGTPDEMVFLPFSTHQSIFERDDSFWFMACTAKPGYRAAQVEEEVSAIVRQAHSIAPTDKGAIWAMNVEEIANMFQGVFLGIDILMWIVGLGALFSGIIGISNIMLVTVRERMREIGVRRALGAKPWNILVQIMSESFLLTAIAGMLGFMMGVAASLWIDKLKLGIGVNGPAGVLVSTEPVVPFGLAITAMVVLMMSGIAAGLLPAWRALKIKAIDAIRDE
jgi:putative ABC transport system permease protein